MPSNLSPTPQTITQTTTFLLVPGSIGGGPDRDLAIGLTGAGWSNLSVQAQGYVSGAPLLYDIPLTTSDNVGPSPGPVTPTVLPVCYYGSLNQFGGVLITISFTGGSITVEAQTGFFNSSPANRSPNLVGLNGSMANLMLNDQNIIATEPALLAFNKIPYQLNLATRPSPLDIVTHNL